MVELEPTPYKTDLWNTFFDSQVIELFVIYTERKNWSPDGGHNYQKWPVNRHAHSMMEGRGVAGALQSAFFVAKKIVEGKADLIYIAGYVHLATVVALICSLIFRKRFVMHSDEFNNGRPQGRFALFKWGFREVLRKASFRFGEAVLVCGRRGLETALVAGCGEEKIRDFPYVIDVDRLRTDAPEVVPAECARDVSGDATIIFFSGRMIPRKGLPTLLAALSGKPIDRKWVLWIEGDGPELDQYKALARELGVSYRCRFLGFCQYDIHSWLIRSSEIVVVPSLIDTWGIIVDEGLQLGKTVISSDATGSGYDRILNGQNGFLFPAGDADSLSDLLDGLIDDASRRALIGTAALAIGRNIGPADNLATLARIMKIKDEHAGRPLRSAL